jgi:hypothetical protein
MTQSTIKYYLAAAAKAFASATQNIQKFAEVYVRARLHNVDEEQKVIEAFKAAYPMFGEREWRRFWMVGNYILMPQFMFKSDAFVGKLLKLKDHMKWQLALVSASEDGSLRVDRGNGPEKVKLSELTKREEKTLTMLLNEKDAQLSPSALIAKFCGMTRKINKNVKTRTDVWEIVPNATGRMVRFNRPCVMGTAQLRDIIKEAEAGQKRKGRSAAAILKDISSEIVKYSQLRDDEWDFEDAHGHRDMWTNRDDREHDRILDNIQKSRNKLTRLVREATGDESVWV